MKKRVIKQKKEGREEETEILTVEKEGKLLDVLVAVKDIKHSKLKKKVKKSKQIKVKPEGKTKPEAVKDNMVLLKKAFWKVPQLEEKIIPDIIIEKNKFKKVTNRKVKKSQKVETVGNVEEETSEEPEYIVE